MILKDPQVLANKRRSSWSNFGPMVDRLPCFQAVCPSLAPQCGNGYKVSTNKLRLANGTAVDASWVQPYARAQALVANMTLDEKVNVTFGWSTEENGCVGVSGSVPRLNFSGFCLQDGPAGVRTTDLVSAFPAQLHLGATWNLSLVHDLTTYMGAEFKAKGGRLYPPAGY